MKEILEKVKNHPLSYILLGIFLLVAYQVIIPSIYFYMLQDWANSSNFWISNLTFLSYYILIAFLLILVFHKSLKREVKEFWKEKKEFIKIGISYWGKGILLMILTNIIVISITGGIAGNEAQNREAITLFPLYSITTMCIFGPFIEEVVFRKVYRKAFKNKGIYIAFTTLLFASLHVISGFDNLTFQNILENWKQLLYFLPYSSLAIFFALAYLETDNIFTSTIAHSLHNTFSVCIILLGSFL